MNRIIFLLLILCLCLTGLSAFNPPEPVSMLGSEISDLFEAELQPLEIYPRRGVEPDEDNVVFYYEGGYYLFLYANRVWQVRYDRTSAELPMGLIIGEGRSFLLSRLLDEEMIPLSSDNDSVTFQLRESPWPVRMTLYFTDERLDDLYIYRSDF